jgi:hypothetical protein
MYFFPEIAEIIKNTFISNNLKADLAGVDQALKRLRLRSKMAKAFPRFRIFENSLMTRG